mmetsp:Transcript_4837/g.11879  ORF Transcript_4837/g.11879 Transcript_4837/m.11879 type:complete len:220 (+) Transcript_4837:662-1321(+)
MTLSTNSAVAAQGEGADVTTTWTVWSSCCTTSRICSRNPRPTRSGISSSISARTPCTSSTRRPTRSSTRPGVPITTCPSVSPRSGVPPTAMRRPRPQPAAAVRRAPKMLYAHSRWGQRISAWGWGRCGSTRDSRARAQPVVFPVPDWAMQSTSFPCTTAGMAWRWIGEGVSIPQTKTPRSSESGIPISSKELHSSCVPVACKADSMSPAPRKIHTKTQT